MVQVEQVDTQNNVPDAREEQPSQRTQKKVQQLKKGKALMDRENWFNMEQQSIIGDADGARVLRPRAAATSYQTEEADN